MRMRLRLMRLRGYWDNLLCPQVLVLVLQHSLRLDPLIYCCHVDCDDHSHQYIYDTCIRMCACIYIHICAYSNNLCLERLLRIWSMICCNIQDIEFKQTFLLKICSLYKQCVVKNKQIMKCPGHFSTPFYLVFSNIFKTHCFVWWT